MQVTVIPQEHSVGIDGDFRYNHNDWTFSDSHIHAIQWNGSTGTIELEDGNLNNVEDFALQIQPYVDWHARQVSLEASAASIDERFYTRGPIDEETNTYSAVPRVLSECQEEQKFNVVLEAQDKLSDTDFLYVRSAELGEAVPAEVSTYRSEVRTTREDRQTAIDACTTVAELETLVNSFDKYIITQNGYIDANPFALGPTATVLKTQQVVNGTYPWPRLAYSRLSE